MQQAHSLLLSLSVTKMQRMKKNACISVIKPRKMIKWCRQQWWVCYAPTHFWRSDIEPKCVPKRSGDCSQALNWRSCRRKKEEEKILHWPIRKEKLKSGWRITILIMFCGLQTRLTTILLTTMSGTRLKDH